jgi:hypothetical protein
MKRELERVPPRLAPAPRRAGWRLLAAGLALAGLVLLFLFNPADHGFYPRCQFHALTGLDCPGCGALRAGHQLLHGHLTAAFRLNPLVVASLPLLAWLAARWARRKLRGSPDPFNVPTAWLWSTLAVLIAFSVLRNLPLSALARLTP